MHRKIKGDKPRLVLSQSLGAFPRPEGDISPLYVFFEAANAGQSDVEIVGVHVGVGGDASPVYDGPFLGEPDLPRKLAPEESVRFWIRAKKLAGILKQAGHGGRPRVRLIVERADGERDEKAFRFRVDEYLQLKDT